MSVTVTLSTTTLGDAPMVGTEQLYVEGLGVVNTNKLSKENPSDDGRDLADLQSREGWTVEILSPTVWRFVNPRQNIKLGPARLREGFYFTGDSVYPTQFNEEEKDQVASVELNKRLGEAKKDWDDVALAVTHARRVLLWGPPGTGKSYAATSIRGNADLFRLYLTMDTPAAEVRGHYLPNDEGGFSWHDGPGIAAWKTGGRLVIDEIDAASGDTLTLLMGLLDDPASAQLTLPTNETIAPKEGFSVVATTNQKPEVLPEALLDRFDVVLNVTHPCPDAFENWHNANLAEAAKRVIFLRDTPLNKAGKSKTRPIGLRAFGSIDRLNAASKLSVQDAARLVIGPEASRWLMTALKLKD